MKCLESLTEGMNNPGVALLLSDHKPVTLLVTALCDKLKSHKLHRVRGDAVGKGTSP